MATADAVCGELALTSGSTLWYIIKPQDDEWHISLTNCMEAWSGIVSTEELSQMSNSSTYSTSEFINKFKFAFGLRRGGSEAFQYKLNDGEGQCTLSWSSALPGDEITVKLGSIKLWTSSETMSEINQDIIKNLMLMNKKTTDQCHTLSRQLEEEKETCGKALKKLEDYVDVQANAEKVLYTNFASVLNEKKRKIRELMDECEILRANNHGSQLATQSTSTVAEPTGKPAGKPARKKPQRRNATSVSACSKPRHTSSKKPAPVSYDSDTEEDMDDDTAEVPETNVPIKRAKPLSQSDDDVTDIDDDIKPTEPMQLQSSPEMPSTSTSAVKQKVEEASQSSRLQSTQKSENVDSLLDDLIGPMDSTSKKASSPAKRRSHRQVAETTDATKVTEVRRSTRAGTRSQTSTLSSADIDSLLHDQL